MIAGVPGGNDEVEYAAMRSAVHRTARIHVFRHVYVQRGMMIFVERAPDPMLGWPSFTACGHVLAECGSEGIAYRSHRRLFSKKARERRERGAQIATRGAAAKRATAEALRAVTSDDQSSRDARVPGVSRPCSFLPLPTQHSLSTSSASWRERAFPIALQIGAGRFDAPKVTHRAYPRRVRQRELGLKTLHLR